MNDMSCMKCGREIPLGQAFCKDCLEDMSHYPINPSTPVQIPIQSPSQNTNRRPSRPRKAKKLEEQLQCLQRRLRIQAWIILLLLILLIGLGIFTYQKLDIGSRFFSAIGSHMTADEASHP